MKDPQKVMRAIAQQYFNKKKYKKVWVGRKKYKNESGSKLLHSALSNAVKLTVK